MGIPGYVRAAIALVSLIPAEAFAATALVRTTISAPPGDVTAGATVQIVCYAESTTGGMSGATMQQVAVDVSAGTANPTVLTGAVTATCASGSGTCSVIQGTSSWATPTTPGSLTATCTATYQSAFGGPQTASSSASITTVAGSSLPPAVSAIAGPSEVVAGTTATFSVTASDPNDPPLPLTYSWIATGGTVVPDATSPGVARWTAPASTGSYTVTATVSNGTAVTTSKVVNVVAASYQAALATSFVAPRRISIGGGGAMAILERQPTDSGRIALVTARGELRGNAELPEPVLAIAHGAGVLWATTSWGSLFKIDPSTGRTLGKVTLADGPFYTPTAMAYDPAGMALWVVESELRRVRVVRPDGTRVATITSAGGAPLVGMVDVAIDAAAGRGWVLLLNPKEAPDAGEPVAVARFLHAYDGSGQYLGSHVPVGTQPGQLTRAGGLAIGSDGRKYVSDSFQGVIQVFAGDASSLGTIGSWGTGQGQLFSPGDLALMGNSDLAVVNNGKIDRFGTGTPLPTCAGDSDCDGLPDDWEIANGLDPHWAGDALVDLDGDGLNNAEEYAYHTNPRNADTDGDGFSDGVEVASGFNPLDGTDHRPVVVASGPSHAPPGLVRLSAVAAGNGNCSMRWTQTLGESVALSSATAASPTFIARKAQAYAFDAVATCGGIASAPARVTVQIDNVAPRADAGRVVVMSPGGVVQLDALASSDANGDPLTFSWDQTLGAPIVGTASGDTISARSRGAGLYEFKVTASDNRGKTGSAEVPVLVASGPAPTAVAGVVPAVAAVGEMVALDARASIVQGNATYVWEKVAAPNRLEDVVLSGANEPVASFEPAAPGRYVFEVSVSSGSLRSPPLRVEVYVVDRGNALPVVTATSPSVVAVNAPVTLDAAAGAGVAYGWRQVSGPAAGLSDAEAASATVVPFAPGFYVFEVSVRDGGAESRPARVAFEARKSGAAIPQARAVLPQPDAIVGQLVFLDGRGSTGATRYRWTQVAGPWVALGAQTAVTTFRPHAPGLYAFELEVDDGTTRSAPSRVEINVLSAQGVQ